MREDRQIRVETILKYSNYNIKADELLVSVTSLSQVFGFVQHPCKRYLQAYLYILAATWKPQES